MAQMRFADAKSGPVNANISGVRANEVGGAIGRIIGVD